MSTSSNSDRLSDTGIALKIIDAVEQDSAKSQRVLASEAGIALGLANAYLKRCVRKGWIKMREAPARRYLYYVTPTGFAEKARLTAEYLSSSLDLFRTARSQCDELVAHCTARGHTRIVLVGASDLAEIAVLSGLNGNVEIVAIIDPASNRARLAGIPVMRSLAEAGAIDAVIVTDIRAPQATYEQLARTMPDAVILTPPILRVMRNRLTVPPEQDEAAE